MSGSVCVQVWFVPSVVRAFEKNDFFDTGITEAQLFLTLHDAVLFALFYPALLEEVIMFCLLYN